MATIQLGRTQSANRLLSYAEKRAEVREGVNCPAEYAKSQMAATRSIWGKTGGIQAHHVIQSFKPGEVTPELANKIGQDLAREIAEGYEAVVYTHTDKHHIHNHIVINSVSYEDGRKYQAHGTEAIERVREASDRLCKEHGLSIVEEPYAEKRYHRAEYGLAKREVVSWKDEIREVIDYERQNSTNYEDFKKNLTEKYHIEVKERGKNISFKHPDSQKFVRGKTLGLAYERGTLEHDFIRQNERGTSQERGAAGLSDEKSESREYQGSERIERVAEAEYRCAEAKYRFAEANDRFERSHEGLHPDKHGQVDSRETDLRYGNNQHQDHGKAGNRSDAFDFDEARKSLEQHRESVARGFERSTKRYETEQQSDRSKNGSNRVRVEQQLKSNERQNESKHERTRTMDLELDR